MTRIAALLLLVGCLHGCSTAPTAPELAQGADVATTAFGIFGAGLSEANPLLAGAAANPGGLAVIAAAKLALADGASGLSREECRSTSGAFFGAGAGAALANAAAIAGATVTWPIAVVAIPAAWYGYDKAGWWRQDCDPSAGMEPYDAYRYALAKWERANRPGPLADPLLASE